jgi:dsDNA-binding SOS-regulon protein
MEEKMEQTENVNRVVKKEGDNIIIDEVENKNIKLTREEVIGLYQNWDKMRVKQESEISQQFEDSIKRVLDKVMKVANAIQPLVEPIVENDIQQIKDIQKSINDLYSAYLQRADTIKQGLTEESKKMAEKKVEELRVILKDFKEVYDKCRLELKLDEKKEERKGGKDEKQ